MFKKSKRKLIIDPAKDESLLNKVSTDSTDDGDQPTGEFKELLKEKPVLADTKKTNPFKKLCSWYKNLSKKQKFAFIAGLIILLGGVIGGIIWLTNRPTPIVTKTEKKAEVVETKSTTEPSRLTGLEIDPELNKRAVTGVMIENSPDARPQSGLTEAGVVFEAVAEGGITRFLALFQEAQPKYIGPVRSVRPYYIDWLHGFDGAVAHAGGSADGLEKIKKEKTKDLDQFANGGAYQRVNSRVAPHNLYTSMAKLDEISKRKGYTSSTFESFERKKETKVEKVEVSTIDVNISSFYYTSSYSYDQKTNSYKRSMAGKPHTDEKSGDQISPKVVIAAITPFRRASNGVNTDYSNIGSGKCYVFQDGQVTIGTWRKKTYASQITFLNDSGKPIKLNPGQTWITAVGQDSGISYK